ncbi:MAG: Zn-ribbon domain-containing OB-fold protein [Candidatus Binataceae bacterium]
MSDQIKPLPVADDLSRPFWEAAAKRRLVVQRCGDCGYYNHPPRPHCDACLSQQLNFVPVSGRGSVWSFTIMHQRDVPGFGLEAPFVNIVVELSEQARLFMVSNLALSERERVRVGAPVEVWFEDRGGMVVPQFRLT